MIDYGRLYYWYHSASGSWATMTFNEAISMKDRNLFGPYEQEMKGPICPTCNGTGGHPDGGECKACGGTGRHFIRPRNRNNMEDNYG